MALPSDKNHKQYTCSRIFCPHKNILHKASPVLCGKLDTAVHSYFVENLFFSKLLGNFKKIQVVESNFSKYLQSAAIVRIDILSGKIFHLQTNNYMTSPVSIPLITLRIWAESQFTFYYYTDSILVVTYTIFRDVLRTQSNIQDGAFLQQQSTAKRRSLFS